MNENIRAMRSRNATTCRFGPTCPSNEMEPRLRRVLLQGRASRNAVRSQLARATSHHPVHAPSPVTANSSATSGRFRGLNKPKTSQLTGVSPGRRSRRQTMGHHPQRRRRKDSGKERSDFGKKRPTLERARFALHCEADGHVQLAPFRLLSHALRRPA